MDAREIDKLFLRKGTCYSLWKKIQKGYALRLYDKIIKDDLEITCRVRNAFAHSPRAINFDTPEVLSAIMRLKYLRAQREKQGIQCADAAESLFLDSVRLLLLNIFADDFP